MRNSALQWQAAIPSDMWMDAMEVLDVARVWHKWRRDVVVAYAPRWTGTNPRPLDVGWFNDFGPEREPAPVYRAKFAFSPALNPCISVTPSATTHWCTRWNR